MGNYIEAGKKRIYFEEHFPEQAGDNAKAPVVIFSHGFNGSHRDFEKECTVLAKRGIAGIRYDFCGGSNESRSSGKTTEMSLISEREDLLSVLDYVKSLEQIDKKRIYLFGGSQGGAVSALTAEVVPDELAGIILLYPAFCIPDDWQKKYPTCEDMPEEVDFWGVRLGRTYRDTVQGWNIWEKIGTYPGPVMILHGDEDAIVPVDYARKAADLYPRAYYREFSGEGHGFSEKGTDQVIELITAFVKSHQVMKVHVKLSSIDKVKGTEAAVTMIPFTGTAEGEAFCGTVLPGGVDTQIEENGVSRLSARYIMEGTDCTGAACRIFLQNEGAAVQHGRVITQATAVTDSEALKEWNHRKLNGAILPAEREGEDIVIGLYTI